jgi:hypothetical protein
MGEGVQENVLQLVWTGWGLATDLPDSATKSRNLKSVLSAMKRTRGSNIAEDDTRRVLYRN